LLLGVLENIDPSDKMDYSDQGHNPVAMPLSSEDMFLWPDSQPSGGWELTMQD